MLTTDIAYALTYDYLAERFEKACQFLRRTDLETLDPGRYPIDEENVVAYIQHYETVDPSALKFETHDKYFDIQYMISGTEAFGYVKRAGLAVSEPYDEEKDITFYQEPKLSSVIILSPGEFATVAPEDAHKPRGMAAAAEAVKKVVIKIRV